jgi:hypothetical protein
MKLLRKWVSPQENHARLHVRSGEFQLPGRIFEGLEGGFVVLSRF